MKIKYFPILLAFIIAAGFTSCKKEDQAAVVTEIFGSVTANIDGVDWKATTASQVGFKVGDSHMTVIANSNDGQTIFLYINGTTVGSYDLAALAGQTDVVCYYRETEEEGDGTSNYVSKTGTVEITEISENRVSGKFNFVGAKSLDETKTITEGVFTNVYYTGKSE